jgi:excisionase family DNA binding protein
LSSEYVIGINKKYQEDRRMAKYTRNPDVIDAMEVAGMLNIDRQTIYKYANNGTIPCQKIGALYRFSRKEIAKITPGAVDSADAEQAESAEVQARARRAS